MPKSFDALLVIDVQSAFEGSGLSREAETFDNIRRLICLCRQNGVPVVYIQHDGGPGDPFERGTAGWRIAHDVAPAAGEFVIEKRFNSAFRQTTLREHLRELRAENLLLCGMQTEYCVDATCKVAFEYGYRVTIASGAVTTFDNNYLTGGKLTRYYETTIWNHRYARVASMEELIAEITA